MSHSTPHDALGSRALGVVPRMTASLRCHTDDSTTIGLGGIGMGQRSASGSGSRRAIEFGFGGIGPDELCWVGWDWGMGDGGVGRPTLHVARTVASARFAETKRGLER